MPQEFSQRVIIVTGGTGALGRTLSTMLLERGASVVVTYRDQHELDHLAHHLTPDQRNRLAPFSLDVGEEKAVAKFVEHVVNQFRRIDGLANLVGGYNAKPFPDMSFEDWRAAFRLNLDSSWLMSRAVAPHMIRANYGRIVSVGSRGAIQAAPGAAHYNASKVGLMWLMESLSNELRGHNITANTVLPSIIDTAANRQAWPQANFDAWVRPEEVAELICYLLSEQSSGTSGAKIPVYGKA